MDQQPARQAAKATVLATPAYISIGPDLALGLKYIDVAVLGEHVQAWSQIVADLASYEGVPFPRKPLAIGGRKPRQGSAAAERDAEEEAIASLGREAESLLGVFRDAAAKFERRLIAAPTKRKRTIGGSSKMLTAPQAAKRLGVAPEKVRNWIEKGELAATNVAQEGSSRPRWRILESDLDLFAKARQPVRARRVPKQRSRKKPATREYF